MSNNKNNKVPFVILAKLNLMIQTNHNKNLIKSNLTHNKMKMIDYKKKQVTIFNKTT